MTNTDQLFDYTIVQKDLLEEIHWYWWCRPLPSASPSGFRALVCGLSVSVCCAKLVYGYLHHATAWLLLTDAFPVIYNNLLQQ